MRLGGLALLVTASLMLFCGCVKAPERIEVNVGSPRPAPVDASRVPHPATLEEAQRELDQAYANLQYLEDQNARLRAKAEDYKRERDDYKKRLKKHEKD